LKHEASKNENTRDEEKQFFVNDSLGAHKNNLLINI